jgi:hypothetical protein
MSLTTLNWRGNLVASLPLASDKCASSLTLDTQCKDACEAQFLKCTHGLGVKAARYNDVYPNVDGMTPAQIRAEYPFCKASFCKLLPLLSAFDSDSIMASFTFYLH